MVSVHVFRLVRKRNGRIVVIAAFYNQALSYCWDFPVHICITHIGHTCHSYVPVPTVLVIIYVYTKKLKLSRVCWTILHFVWYYYYVMFNCHVHKLHVGRSICLLHCDVHSCVMQYISAHKPSFQIQYLKYSFSRKTIYWYIQLSVHMSTCYIT